MLKSMWAYFCTARFNQRIPSISHPKPHTVNMRDDLCRLKVARLSGNREGPSRWTNDVDLCIIPRKIWPLLTPSLILKNIIQVNAFQVTFIPKKVGRQKLYFLQVIRHLPSILRNKCSIIWCWACRVPREERPECHSQDF
jgi:hypothetical protein